MILGSACLLASTALLLRASDPELPVVPNLDLKRYQGKWFEIARLPNSFQKKCESNVIANYTLEPDEKVGVVNTCVKADGETTKATATARIKDKNGSPAKLKVTFFWFVSGDYWVIGLDPDYRWAMVGTPNRKYLWILSRTPALAAATYHDLLGCAKELGFDTSKVQRTSQHW